MNASSQGTGTRDQIAAALRDLGASTAKEIGHHIGRDPTSLSDALKAMERDGCLRVAGRAPYEPGQRGPAPRLWDLVEMTASPTNGATPALPVSASPAVRLAVSPGADLAAAAIANHRAEAAEAFDGDAFELTAARQRITELEQQRAKYSDLVADLRAQLAAAASEPAAVTIQPDDSADDLAALADLVDLPPGAPGHIVAVRLQVAFRWFQELGYTVEGGAAITGRQEMRRAYFDALLKLTLADSCEEHIFDRLERIVAGGTVES